MSDDWKLCALTVGQLRELLADVPDDTPVILSKDAEGNGYSPLSSVNTDEGTVYVPETTWSGEVYTLDGRDDDTYDVYYPEDGVRVVELGPVN